MDDKMKSRGALEEDVCDTCSGDSDDVCSLCSWTTDHEGEFSNLAHNNINGPSWGAAQDSITNVPPVGFPNELLGGSMQMCVGFVPVFCHMVMQDCAMNFRPMENAMFSQDGSTENTAHEAGYPGLGAWTRPATSWTATQNTKATQSPGSSEATTIILRSLPFECTRDRLLQLLDDEGFKGMYNFVHMPIDFQTKTCLGYAIMNLVSHDAALCVERHFGGFSNWPWYTTSAGDNVCEVAWNSPHQGLSTNIERYRNSPLMHASVPATYRPVLFRNGARVKFPHPTTRIRAPRIRHQKPETYDGP